MTTTINFSNWDSINENISSNSGPRVPFMKLQAGKNVVRIASMPAKVFQHWEKTVSGQSRKVPCTGDDCPLCKMGHTANARFQIKVLDKIVPDQPIAKILEIGPAVMKQITNFATDEDYGDPTQYDLKIQKEGVGQETRYSVTASPRRSPLDSHDQALIDALPDIAEINKPLTQEQIDRLNLKCFAVESDLDNGGFQSDDDFNNITPNQRKSQALNEWDNL